MTGESNLLFNLLKRKRNKLSTESNHHQNYIAQSMIDDGDYISDIDTRYYKHLKSAERFALIERLKGRQVNIWDNKEKRFLL